MLLGERVRDPAERRIVKATIEETMKVTIDDDILYGASTVPSVLRHSESIIWTRAMRRLFVLVSSALKNHEPVLLVGETGCGKTQVCQVMAVAFDRPLNIYNAHTNTETGDLIGSQRPIRSRSQLAADVFKNFGLLNTDIVTGADPDVDQVISRFNQLDTTLLDPDVVRKTKASIAAYHSLFEWSDGSLVRSMRFGEHFLLDEISLADDSVLERLNSVLEPARTILLAEKGSVDNVIVAHGDFQFLATMNPGGDYGKRELSTALRNRLTEIWVPPLSEEEDVLPILTAKLKSEHSFLAPLMLKFSLQFNMMVHSSATTTIPLRDLLAWIQFVDAVPHLSPEHAFLHGSMMVYVDSVGANPASMASSSSNVELSRQRCLDFLQTLVSINVTKSYEEVPSFNIGLDAIQVGPFSVSRAQDRQSDDPGLVFEARTTLRNTMRLVRALQMERPVLLEGSPGVGKTAIVTALAQLLGKPLRRINLSDQTDLMDLFGADAPAEDEALGRFTWKDGPLLQAMQAGEWVLLDEMNLASQSVLEGLNSCFDHRKEVYIAELDKTFHCHPNFMLFAAQNPHHQGGGRKGLPASFVNRFTVVYADPLKEKDLLCICLAKYASADQAAIETVVQAVSQAARVVSGNPVYSLGGPWEINLRDVDRWLQLSELHPTLDPMYHCSSIITHRYRNASQQHLLQGQTIHESFYPRLTTNLLQVGLSFLQRDQYQQHVNSSLPVPVQLLPQAKSLITALSHAWPVVLVGSSGAGKTQLVRSLAAASGAKLLEVSMNAEIDTVDLLGGYEQYDERREIEHIKDQAARLSEQRIKQALSMDSSHNILPYLELHRICQLPTLDPKTLLSALQEMEILESRNNLARRLQVIAEQNQVEQTRFVWNDGVLVDAVQEGSWLVLDNANLCNASVLDRLNSLLEPNGHLIISEQHNADGGVRSIKPHPAFRVILTMDPRYGELSKAMRNRSLEIFLEANSVYRPVAKGPRYPWTASIGRLRHAFSQLGSENTMIPFVDDLASEDLELTQTHPLSDSDLDLGLATAQAVLRKYRQSASTIWPRMQELVESLLTLKSRHTLDLHDQPQHLTLNEPLFQDIEKSDSWKSISSLERIRRVTQDLSEIIARLRAASEHVSKNSRSITTVLERSATMSTVAKRNEHVLAPFFRFASLMIDLLHDVITTTLHDVPQPGDSSLSLDVTLYVKDMVNLADATDVNMAELQAMLQIGHSLAYHLQWANFQKALGLFSITKLDRGLGLQRMWHSWRPRTPRSLPQLETRLLFEKMIERLNNTAGSLPESRVEYLNVKERLLEAAEFAWELPDAEELLQAITQSMEMLEVRALRRRRIGVIFQDMFDFMARRTAILVCPLTQQSLQLLKMFSNEIQPMSACTSKASPVQYALRTLAVARKHLSDRNLKGGRWLVQKLHELPNQPLRSLVRLQEEVLGVANLLTSNSNVLDLNMLPSIKRQVEVLLIGILAPHSDFFWKSATTRVPIEGGAELNQFLQLDLHEPLQPRNEENAYFQSVYQSYLQPAMKLLRSGPQVSVGRALILVSLAALILMVPDKPFDPALREQVIQDRYKKRKGDLHTKIEAQIAFNQQLMGQDSSLVLRLLEEELAELGDEPVASAVVRPEVSTLSKVQTEFSNILRTIVDAPLTYLLQEDSESDNAVRESDRVNQTIDRLIVRLGSLDRAYDDLVVPVSQLLQCLGLGAQLVASGKQDQNRLMSKSKVLGHVPLLGARRYDMCIWPVKSVYGQFENSSFWLESYVLHRSLGISIYGDCSTSSSIEYLRVIDGLYEHWKVRLATDQVAAEAKSRYYAYRGDDDLDGDAENEELSRMFPSFENDEGKSQSPDSNHDSRGIAVKLAGIHERIFATTKDDGGLRDFVLEGLRQLSLESASQTDSTFENIMSGILLQVEAKLHTIKGESTETAINIYTDTSINALQKVYKLVQDIQARFYEISERWPEHAVPAEVISFSDELLELELSSPLAKLLTKGEKLLEIIGQWQNVASHEWSVAAQMNELTTLIVSWRRLELASWSRLLDLEKHKVEEETRAWYFIAYEAVVYNSRRVVETGEDATVYAQELAETIEGFMRTTSLGHYRPRLKLLETLLQSLFEATTKTSGLSPITSSIASIMAHYARYVPHLEKTLKTGQDELEKAVVEQITLASWKDTNVTALRDSARRSHQKLFRIVRKYRALLGKPVSTFKSEEPVYDQQHVSVELSAPAEEDWQFQRALRICAAEVPGWESRPERLRNPLVSTSSLRRVYQTQIDDLDVGAEIVTFREDLATSSETLRKETPATLSVENTGMVRHLRERKKRLFADTIKSLAQMGIRRNLATSELEKQSSVAAVLSNSPDLTFEGGRITSSWANIAFHELLDSMPQARMALAEHSPDLTDGEVRRSVGLLEGLLSLSIRQRDFIARSINDFESLTTSVSSLRTLASIGNQVSLRLKGPSAFVDGRQSAWLPAILDVAGQILRFQDKHSWLSLQSLIATLQRCSTEIRQEHEEMASLPRLPDGLIGRAEFQAQQRVQKTLLELRTVLGHWADKEPNIQYLTGQVLAWTDIPHEDPQPTTNGSHHVFATEIDEAAKVVANSVFVALQQLTGVKTQAPSSTEEPGWLLQNDRRFAERWAAIHVPTIAEGLQNMLRKIQHVPAQDLSLTISLVSVIAPILLQFHTICEHMLNSQMTVHLGICRLACYVTKIFGTLATQGYCTPADSTERREQEGKMESGTGLGDGEGAEDISKDISADEDLSEFAKDGEKKDGDESIEGAEDAVDMGMDELEGETGEFQEKEGEDEDDGENEKEGEGMDEETGSVDDLDPTAVDEKMWDDVKEHTEKEKEKELKGEMGKGDESKDETAADMGEKVEDDVEGAEHENGETNEEKVDDDDDTGVEKAEAENADSHLQEEKALDLPEEMQLTGEEEGKEDDLSDDAMDELSDIEQPEEVDQVEDPDGAVEKSIVGSDESQDSDAEAEPLGQVEDAEVGVDQPSEDGEEKSHVERGGDTQYDDDDNAGIEAGAANQLQDDIDHDQKAEGQNENNRVNAERQQQGGKATEHEEDGRMGQAELGREHGRETTLEQQEDAVLKKLADVLDQWHQRREILNTSRDQSQGKLDGDADMAEADFEHIENEEEGDAQALGSAGAEQGQKLDQGRAIQDDDEPIKDDTAMPHSQEQAESVTMAQRLEKLQAQAGGERRDDGSFVPDRNEKQGGLSDDRPEDTDGMIDNATSEIDHLELGQRQAPSPLTSSYDAAQIWNYCSQATHQFSLVLTEQLRLILSPTTATKLRGDYRTGKRLNLKRIIPYIASGYKRDKIWMRRSVPSKRNYQIMLAVDDSKSMAESGADILALQTTAMLCKSLAMLEVGELSVLSFGEGGNHGVKIAHPFGEVWKSDDSGIEVFRNFSFNQKGTDVRALMERGLNVLRDARLKVQGAQDETWQLFLIISDGHCGDHEKVRRLVREGKAERVLCVFIILDNLNSDDTVAGEERKGESILDLKEAVFVPDPNREGEMRVVTRRYLERFPFEFYLVVRDVRDLPGVLARCLRGWFGSVERS